MDNYTCVLWTRNNATAASSATAAAADTAVLQRLVARLLAELLAPQRAHCGASFVAVVGPAGVAKSAVWHRVEPALRVSDVVVSGLATEPCQAGYCAEEAAAARQLHTLADQLPAASAAAVVSLLWCPAGGSGSSEHAAAAPPPPAHSPLYSVLVRYRLWHNSVLTMLLPSDGAQWQMTPQSALSEWRQLLRPSCQLQLRPSFLLRVHSSCDARSALPSLSADGGGGTPVYFNCDSDCWHQMERRWRLATATCPGRLTISPTRGLDIVAAVRRSSVPAQLQLAAGAGDHGGCCSVEFVHQSHYAGWLGVARRADCALLARVYLISADTVVETARPHAAAAGGATSTAAWYRHLSDVTARSGSRPTAAANSSSAAGSAAAVVGQPFVAVHFLLRPHADGFVSGRLLADISGDGGDGYGVWRRVAGGSYVPLMEGDEWRCLLRHVTALANTSHCNRPAAPARVNGVLPTTATAAASAADVTASGERWCLSSACPLQNCACQPCEATALSYWRRVLTGGGGPSGDTSGGGGSGATDSSGHNSGDCERVAPPPKSVVLSADGILRAWRPSAVGWLTPSVAASGGAAGPAAVEPHWQRQAEATVWPAAAALQCHGVHYNHTPLDDASDRRAARLRDSVVGHAETASSCSVWRSDAVTVRLNASSTPATAAGGGAAKRVLRRSPRKQPTTQQQQRARRAAMTMARLRSRDNNNSNGGAAGYCSTGDGGGESRQRNTYSGATRSNSVVQQSGDGSLNGSLASVLSPRSQFDCTTVSAAVATAELSPCAHPISPPPPPCLTAPPLLPSTSRQQLRRSPRKRCGAATPTATTAASVSARCRGGRLHPTAAGASTSSASLSATAKQKLKSVICVALGELAVQPCTPMFQPCALHLYRIVRAYVVDPAGAVSSRQLLKYARLHAQHVVDFQNELGKS